MRTFSLDMIPGGAQTAVACNQYESGDTWVFALYYDGGRYEIPTGAEVFITGTKPDGAAYKIAGTVADNAVVIEVTEQMTACAGRSIAEILVESETDGTTLYSANFPLLVEPAAVQGDLSSSEIPSAIVDTDGNVYYESKSILGLYPVESASGDVAVIHDGADSLPVRDLSVAIEPAQSLNGYDKPWAGGAGKNILPLTAGTKTANGVTATVNANGVITLSGTATADGFLTIASGMTFEAGTYTLKEFTGSGKITSTGTRSQVISSTANTGISVQWSDAQGTAKSGTLATASDYIFRIRIENGKSYAGVTITTMLVKGSDAPTAYEPYSNICPISGWDALKVARTGKNLLTTNDYQTDKYGITFTKNADGSIKASGTSTGNARAFYRGLFLPAGRYLFGGCPSGGSSNTYHVYMWDYTTGARPMRWDGTTGSANDVGTGFQEVLVEPGHEISINCRIQSGTTVNNLEFHPIILAEADAGTTWTPSEAEVTDITLPTTVYGGTLDVTTGVLTVDRAVVDLGSLSWGYASTRFYATSPADTIDISDTGDVQALCDSFDRYETGALANMPDASFFVNSNKMSTTVKRIVVKDSRYTDAGTFKTAMSGVMLCYTLATPQTYTLTPVQVKTLLGENRIYADAGDVTVEYRVDFNEAGLMFIPKAPTADGSYRLTADVTGGTPTYRWEAE